MTSALSIFTVLFLQDQDKLFPAQWMDSPFTLRNFLVNNYSTNRLVLAIFTINQLIVVKKCGRRGKMRNLKGVIQQIRTLWILG